MSAVAEVVWFDPALRTEPEKAGKIIDASLAFMDNAPIGTKLYTNPQQGAVNTFPRILDDSQLHGWAHQAHDFKRQNADYVESFTNELGNEICLLAWTSASNPLTVRYFLEGPRSHAFQTMTPIEAERLIVQLQAALGETGMVPVTGKERPMLRPEAASTEARFESASLHQSMLEALKEANAFILAPAEDLKECVLSRIRDAIDKAEGRS